MLYRRCDIKDLIDEKIEEAMVARESSDTYEDELAWATREKALQEIRVGIFELPYVRD